MRRNYYECHVTFIGGASSRLIATPVGWKFSRIDGDPVLGDGIKSYITKQFKGTLDLDDVIEQVEQAADYLRQGDRQVLRTKVELVVYDSKQLPRELLNG